MHYKLKNYLIGWRGSFTIGTLDSWPSCSRLALWLVDLALVLWVARMNNDINMLNQSSLFTDILKGRSTKSKLHGQWTWVQPRVLSRQWCLPLLAGVCEDNFPPINFKESDVCCMQGGHMEDIEKAFWILKVGFHILASLGHPFLPPSIQCDIMQAYIIHDH